jgi:hypothetical protein
MATFQKFKQTGNRVLYRQEGSKASVRFMASMFAGGEAPDTVEVEAEFAPISAQAAAVAESPEIVAAKELLRQHRAKKAEAREAARAAKGLPPKTKGSAKSSKPAAKGKK